MSLFCFGIGYTVEYVMCVMNVLGIPCIGTVRGLEKCKSLNNAGIPAILFDDAWAVEEALAEADRILSSVPPDEEGDPVLRNYVLPRDRVWTGYLSTTGVYGDHQGNWVDETTPAVASEPRLLRRLDAERQWLDLGAHILRLSGIYGPGRSALDSLRDGTARRIDKPGQYFSRIHVEDIARAILQSISRPAPGEVYNVCDDEPAPSSEVVAYAAGLLNLPIPPLVPYEEAELSPMARSFYQSNRRVSNRKIKEKLGLELRYPTYREGLTMIAEREARIAADD